MPVLLVHQQLVLLILLPLPPVLLFKRLALKQIQIQVLSLPILVLISLPLLLVLLLLLLLLLLLVLLLLLFLSLFLLLFLSLLLPLFLPLLLPSLLLLSQCTGAGFFSSGRPLQQHLGIGGCPWAPPRRLFRRTPFDSISIRRDAFGCWRWRRIAHGSGGGGHGKMIRVSSPK